MKTINTWLFKRMMRWYVSTQLDQFDRFMVHFKRGPYDDQVIAYVRIDLQCPDNHGHWDILI